MTNLLDRDLLALASALRGGETRSTWRGPSGLDTSRSTSPSGRVGLGLFRGTVRELLTCPTGQVSMLHGRAVHQVRQAMDRAPYVEALLDLCIEVRSEGGLDVAADVLAGADHVALRYAQSLRRIAPVQPAPAAAIHDRPNTDRWVVLIRAASRASRGLPDLFPFLMDCLSALDRSVREAVVEGLAMVADQRALGVLKQLAEEDADPLIRRCAQECLAETSGS